MIQAPRANQVNGKKGRSVDSFALGAQKITPVFFTSSHEGRATSNGINSSVRAAGRAVVIE